MAKKRSKAQPEVRIWNVVKIIGSVVSLLIGLLILFFVGMLFLSFVTILAVPPELQQGNVAVIPIEGIITTDSPDCVFCPDGISSKDIAEFITEADEDEDINAIIIEINSPGGTPVATDEIAHAIKETEKPTYAVIREVGASGGYWIASATDKIYTNRMSVTGSIGVIASYTEFAGLLERFNMTHQRLVAGEHKDIGDPRRELTQTEKSMIQVQLNKLHDIFIEEVATNRNMSQAKVKELATGWVYLGEEAVALGLADQIGNLDDALADLETQLNITATPVTYKKGPAFLEALSGVTKEGFYQMGRGVGSTLTEKQSTPFTI